MNTQIKNILVIGARGQVATALKEQGQSFGFHIIAAGRDDINIMDTGSILTCAKSHDIDAVVNAAAYTAVDTAESEEPAANALNRDAVENLARAASELAVPFIHISTDYVFDGSKGDAYREDDKTNPIGAYGRSKLAGERVAVSIYPSTIILRTAWVYSETGKNFVKTMLHLAKTRDSLGVVADQYGNPTYAADIAIACLKILEYIQGNGWKEELAGIYNVAGHGDTNWHGFAKEIFDISAELGGNKPSVAPISTSDYPTPAKRPTNSRLDTSKLANQFAIQMPFWRDSLRKCIKNLSENNDMG